MHASSQELITLRDGQLVSAEIVLHVAGCKQCSAELALLRARRLDLQRLPAFQPPQGAWAAIDQRLQAPLRSRMRNFGWIAAAAVAVIAVTSIWFVPRSVVPQSAGSTARADDSVAALVARSQQLESMLQGMPSRPAVERATTSAAIEALQSRIQALDVQLAATDNSGANGDQARRLWSDRVQLMSSLLDVRYAEAARGSYRSVDTLYSNGAI